ncbi:MAG: hypothetical protein KF838_07980 [Phycisphaeraceae bacterium]|nr:MAG: hypothetical protein KF838_07980 [Phycisphaeraceae bacterium]
MSDQANVLARDGNTAVVHLSGRAFPAIAMQGDTFFHMIQRIRAAHTAATRDECNEELQYLLADLEEQLAFYERTLKANSVSLPY